MRICVMLTVCLAILPLTFSPGRSYAQSALDELEKKATDTLPPTIAAPPPTIAAPPAAAPPATPPSVTPEPRPIPGAPPAVAEPGYLGLFTDDRPGGTGVPVVEVEKGGPADLAGIRTEDRIVSMNGRRIRTNDDVAAVLTGKVAFEALQVGILRGGRSLLLTVRLGAQPAETKDGSTPPARTGTAPAVSPPADAATGKAQLGVTVATLDGYLIRMNRLPLTRGAFINSVSPGSIADQNGLRVGDVIVSAAGIRINSADDIIRVMGSVRYGNEVEFLYYRSNRLYRKNITFPGVPAPAAGHSVSKPPVSAETQALRDQVKAMDAQIRDLKQRIKELEAAGR